MAAFARPPDHPEYPAECLLHAMVATATDLAGLDAWEGEARYWTEGQSPAVFHADLAEVKRSVPLRMFGNHADRVLRRAVPLAARLPHRAESPPSGSSRCPLCLSEPVPRPVSPLFVDLLSMPAQQAAISPPRSFSRAYIDTSIAVRICTSLGLNHNVFLPNHLPLSSFLAHRTALPPPQDEEEARERSVTWWFAYTVETFSAAATVSGQFSERADVGLIDLRGWTGMGMLHRRTRYHDSSPRGRSSRGKL
jgi:hypothetical protein